MPAPLLTQKIHQLLKPTLPHMISTLRQFVTAESPSLEKTTADRCCELIGAYWNKQGLEVQRIPQKHRGNHLRIVFHPPSSRSPQSQLLVLGHYDTVYASGTLKKMPFQITAGKAYGPGVFDMKAGIVQALFAFSGLCRLKLPIKKESSSCGPLTKKSEATLPEDSSNPKPAAAMPFLFWNPLSALVAC